MSSVLKYGFIGGGNMAEALIRGMIQGGRLEPADIMVSDPQSERRRLLSREFQVKAAETNHSLVEESNVLILAVKPQVMDSVLTEVGPVITADQLVISIAAGVTIQRIQSALAASAPVVRAMPNTPALVLAGAAALAAGDFATDAHMAQARMVFEAVGEVIEISENQLDVVTGLSGSGPAYVFVLLEAMTEGAVRLGMVRDQARLLAYQTVLGAAQLAKQSGFHPAQLKEMVTSPGGTTAAGLYELEKSGFRGLIMDAVASAALRARELGRD